MAATRSMCHLWQWLFSAAEESPLFCYRQACLAACSLQTQLSWRCRRCRKLNVAMQRSTELLVGSSRGKLLCVDMLSNEIFKKYQHTPHTPKLHRKEKWSFSYFDDTCCLDDILSYLLKTNPVNFAHIGEEPHSENNHLYFSAV